MEKKTSIILNIVFGIMFIIGVTLTTSNYVTSSPDKQTKEPPTVTYVLDANKDEILDTLHTTKYINNEKNSVNWEGILTALGGIISFIIKIYYDQKGKHKSTEVAIAYDNNTHPIFSIIKELQLADLKNFDLGTPGRTQVFKDMIQVQIFAYESALRNFINTDFTDSADFRTKARYLILKIVEDYENTWRENGIPEIVITRYKTLQQDRIHLLLNDIETLSFYRLSDETKNFNEVIFYLLTYTSIVLRLSLASDTMQTLRDLNGTLKTVVYKGQPL